ncbi:ABC transporter ATP-binding protein [Candidatus Saccharibacteria bacterium]|nr:ABC transporter ATP-binding protein [Candidatus Saccharibacteria bacterium]
MMMQNILLVIRLLLAQKGGQMSNLTGAVGKPKNMRASFRVFIKSIRKYRWSIILSVLLTVISAVLGLFIPKILGDMTTIAVNSYPDIDWSALGGKAILAIVLFCASSLLGYGQAYILAVVSAKYTKDLREQIIEKIFRMPISYFDKHQYGDTLSRMSNDVDVITTSMSQEIADVSMSLTTLIGVIIVMLTISVPLSLISFIVVPVSVLAVGQIMRFAQKYFREQQSTLGVLNSKIEEDYSGEVVIKSNSHEEEALADFTVTNEKLATATRKAQVFSSLSFPVTHVFTNLGYVAVCVMGGISVIEGQINIGDIQAFIQYVSRFNRPITEIASTTSTIQALLAASERIFEFLNETEEEPDVAPAREIAKVHGEVEFHDVCFEYLPGQPVIRDFSVKVKPGMNVAIVGPTGAGKTTIINLLMRFYEPTSGYITIDGVPIREMRRADVRALFGMVLQDTWLFSGTVEENLRYGKMSASLDDIRRAAKASNVDHIIEALPKAYKSPISEDSDNVSAGEKQLLTIARAMVANPPMMILDEATSNVDTRTEQLIQDSFERLTSGRTSFVIAHRLSTIRNADLILVMRDGKIIEQGNHAELLKANGFYAELYNSQFAEG